MREGPNLNIARCGHSCNKMIINEKVFIIVAGGFFEDSVELLDPMSDQGWIFGKYVMFQILDRKLLIFGILVVYLVANPRFKRLTRPEDEMLLVDREN